MVPWRQHSGRIVAPWLLLINEKCNVRFDECKQALLCIEISIFAYVSVINDRFYASFLKDGSVVLTTTPPFSNHWILVVARLQAINGEYIHGVLRWPLHTDELGLRLS